MKHRINHLLVHAFIVGALMIFYFHCNVYASLTNNTPEYKDVGYHRRMDFSTSGIAVGDVHYVITADLTEYDTMTAPYALPIQRCCDRLVQPAENGFWIAINGQQVYADTKQEVTNNIYGPNVKKPEINIKGYRSRNATITYDGVARMKQCSYCGTNTPTQFFFSGLSFYDYRGVATMQTERLSITKGQNVTLTPSYNEYTDHVEWGIRYPGESGFTLLSEGTNRGGIVASGVKNRNITLSSIPFSAEGIDIGVFVYDENGNLPAGTCFPETPFFTKLASVDEEGPVINISKAADMANKAVNVTINAMDNVGLPNDAYSWDGGNSFGTQKAKAFYSPGTYEVVVKDIAGNKTKKSFYIDSLDIEAANPSKVEDVPASELVGESEKGGNGNSLDRNDADHNNNEETSSKPDVSKNDRPENINTQLKNEESVVVKPLPVTMQSSDKEGGQNLDSMGSSDEASKKQGQKKSGDNRPTALSDSTTKGLFDKIKENSEKYMISMHDRTGEEELEVNADIEPEIDMNNNKIDEEYADSEYVNSNENGDKDYHPRYMGKSKYFWIAIVLLSILLILILLFVLFFGVIIFTDKETELSELYGEGGTKIPIAITFVTYENGHFSVCFRELLDKYGMVYARFGLVFAAVFEGEKISITTKFNGDRKREIATERIKKEIIVGIKGGKK